MTQAGRLGHRARNILDRDSVEYAIARHWTDERRSGDGTQDAGRGRALFDPVWGGVDQYSTYGDWKHPHYEKLATMQGQYLRIYALALPHSVARPIRCARQIRSAT